MASARARRRARRASRGLRVRRRPAPPYGRSRRRRSIRRSSSRRPGGSSRRSRRGPARPLRWPGSPPPSSGLRRFSTRHSPRAPSTPRRRRRRSSGAAARRGTPRRRTAADVERELGNIKPGKVPHPGDGIEPEALKYGGAGLCRTLAVRPPAGSRLCEIFAGSRNLRKSASRVAAEGSWEGAKRCPRGSGRPPSPLARVARRPNLLSYLRRLRLRVASAAV